MASCDAECTNSTDGKPCTPGYRFQGTLQERADFCASGNTCAILLIVLGATFVVGTLLAVWCGMRAKLPRRRLNSEALPPVTRADEQTPLSKLAGGAASEGCLLHRWGCGGTYPSYESERSICCCLSASVPRVARAFVGRAHSVSQRSAPAARPFAVYTPGRSRNCRSVRCVRNVVIRAWPLEKPVVSARNRDPHIEYRVSVTGAPRRPGRCVVRLAASLGGSPSDVFTYALITDAETQP
eukprot:1852598-Prymnesium_polylepis.1